MRRIKLQEGTDAVPFSFTLLFATPSDCRHFAMITAEKRIEMVNNTVIAELENMINGILQEMPGYFLVQVRIKPTNNIKVFLDGDSGINIDTCIKINRRLYSLIEEKGMFPDGNFSLEVSSPGVGEPLILQRQYIKNIGRQVRVEALPGASLTEGSEEPQPFLEGELKAVHDDSIEMETLVGKGKKAQILHHTISFNNIKSTSVLIKF